MYGSRPTPSLPVREGASFVVLPYREDLGGSICYRYHRIYSSVVVFTAYGTEAAEYLTEGLGADALHEPGIAAGEMFVDMGGAEQGGGFAFAR